MKRPDDDDTLDVFVLECSGRQVYANNGIIGINPELQVYNGYDGGLDAFCGPGESSAFTREEQREIADYMIRLWIMYKHNMPPE